MNTKTSVKSNSSSQNNSNSNPFPKLKPRGSIIINQKSKIENKSPEVSDNSNLNNKGNNFLSILKRFDPKLNKNKEETILKRNKEKKEMEEKLRREKEEEKRRRKEEEEKKEKEEQERIRKINEENIRREEEEKRMKEEERRRKKEEAEKEEKEAIERIKRINEERIREEQERQKILEEERRREKMQKEEEKYKIFVEKNNELHNAIENYNKNEKIILLNEQNIKNIGEKLENLSDYEKIHLLDRKINTNEIKEKMNLNVTLKNPNKEYKYEIEIYDDEGKLISKTEQKTDKNEVNLCDNSEFFYEFTKTQSITVILIKHINSIEKIRTIKTIPLKKLISNINNGNYEERIENFEDNELINICLDSPKESKEDKLVELNFNTDENGNKTANICYTIQKDDKILFKSPFCNSSNIKQSDKIKLCDLEPEFEISFYNNEYEEKTIKIKTEELTRGVTENINLPKIDNLKIKISSEERKGNNLIKLLKKGLNLNLSIAIDFTSSNGFPWLDSSLHNIKSGFVNNYEKAMRENIKIISIYNKNDKYDVYGFGAEILGNFKKIFNLNGTDDDPSIKGIDNIISEYKKTVNRVDFSGNTYFAPIIKKIKKKLEIDKGNDFNYHILLIISDGLIHDIDQTIDSIIEASKFPISFIIIGIGANVSDDMKILNGEKGKLISSKGEVLNKDIVQYVHFNDYADDLTKLTQAVLKYIPDQMSNYFKDNL